jgi:hypothetical protein
MSKCAKGRLIAMRTGRELWLAFNIASVRLTMRSDMHVYKIIIPSSVAAMMEEMRRTFIVIVFREMYYQSYWRKASFCYTVKANRYMIHRSGSAPRARLRIPCTHARKVHRSGLQAHRCAQDSVRWLRMTELFARVPYTGGQCR